MTDLVVALDFDIAVAELVLATGLCMGCVLRREELTGPVNVALALLSAPEVVA